MEERLSLRLRQSFTVAGILGEGNANEGPSWILPLWQKANSGRAEHGAPQDAWGLMGHPDKFLGRWGARGLYLAGFETEADAPVPEGWTKWTVPEQTYLVADCSQSRYGEVFEWVLGVFLPSRGLEMVGAAHERYPEPNNPEKVELWFPIHAGMRFCQSCGMPLAADGDLGTEADGSPSYDYCVYCYKDGAFTTNQTMEEMIETCLLYNRETGVYGDESQARRDMTAWFPTLKRWKK